jgi:ParB family chromosome partitioning protein
MVAGERRWRACKIAGWKEIPAIVRTLEDHESLEAALVENIQRADLNPVDEARAYRTLSEEHHRTHDEIARRVGKDRSTVTNLLRILKLPEQILEYVSRGTLSLGHARVLLGVPEDQRNNLVNKILRESWSVRDAEAWARKIAAVQGSAPLKRPRGQRKPDSVARLEEQLCRHFGSEVRIRVARHGGRLEFRYHDDEDLSRLLDQFGVVVA